MLSSVRFRKIYQGGVSRSASMGKQFIDREKNIANRRSTTPNYKKNFLERLKGRQKKAAYLLQEKLGKHQNMNEESMLQHIVEWIDELKKDLIAISTHEFEATKIPDQYIAEMYFSEELKEIQNNEKKSSHELLDEKKLLLAKKISEKRKEFQEREIKKYALYELVMYSLETIKNILGTSYESTKKYIQHLLEKKYERDKEVVNRGNEVVYHMEEFVEEKKKTQKRRKK